MYLYSKVVLLVLFSFDFVKSLGEDMNFFFIKVDSLKVKILGIFVLIEKFVVEKGQRYGIIIGWFIVQFFLEFIYVWSGFRIMSKKLGFIKSWFLIIDKGEEFLREYLNKEYGIDDISFLNLLKGLCLKYLGRYFMVEEYFNCVI